MHFQTHAINAFYHPLKRIMLTYCNPCIKVACTSGPFFEKKIMKRYPIFSLQRNYYQIDQMHKNISLVKFFLTASKREFSYFLQMV